MATVTGTIGNDTSNDTVGTSDVYNMGTGNDTVFAGAGNDTVNGDAGNDVLDGGAGNDRLFGGANDDYLYAGTGAAGDADSLDGGTGVDTVDFSQATTGITVTLNAGAATVVAASSDTLVGIEAIVGSGFNDSITGDANNNYLSGGVGNDTLSGGDGVDTLLGGLGADSLIGGTGGDSIDGGSGIDTVDYSASGAINITIGGGAGTGSDAAGDTISNVEYLIGSGSGDTLGGSAADETIDGAAGADTITAAGGNDSLIGGAGADTLDGGAGNDTLVGGLNNDSMVGGAGNDYFFAGAAANGDNDVISGGADFDIVDFSEVGSGLTITLNAGNATVNPTGGNNNDILSGIEGIVGTGLADNITGDTVGNYLAGGAGADTLSGGAGDDTLLGGNDADSLVGGAGNDSIDGGAGVDTVDYSASAAGINITIDGGAGSGGDAQGDTLTAVENVIGTGNADTIFGSTGNETIDGGAGSDSLGGAAGNDSLVGGAGNDTIDGGADNDTLAGGADDDQLSGGAGTDSLTGDAGNDILVGGAGADVISGGAGTDTASYVGSGAGVNVTINGAAGVGGDAAGDTLTGIENLTGSSNGDTLVGDSGANSIDGADGSDSISAGDGNDTVLGGAGDDTITAGPATGGGTTSVPLDFNWSALGDGTNITNVTQDTGGVNVNVALTTPGTNFTSFQADTADPIYVDTVAGETFDPNSAGWLARSSNGAATVTDITFAGVSGSGMSNNVEDVAFRISDIDTGTFVDRVIIKAWDTNGNPVTITYTETSTGIAVSGDTITASGGGSSPDLVFSSVLINIAGPVSRIQITYDNLGTTTQYIYVSDIQFNAIQTTADADSVDGGIGNDIIGGGWGDDTLLGSLGNDSINGGVGNDSIDGGADNDTVSGDAGNDTVLGGAGNDSVSGGADNDSVDGGADNDTVSGDAGNDTVLGGTGNDVVSGGTGNDSVDGGADNDTVSGDAGNDTVLGGAGNDVVDGGADNDSVNGGTGNDSLIGGTGTDTMSGAAGNDTFVILPGEVDAAGNDVILGGGGTGEGGTGAGQTTATDFDTIDLQGIGANRVTVNYTSTDPLNLAGTVIIYTDATKTVEQGRIDFSEIEKVIICFTPGTMIETDKGRVAVEDLRAGDLVMTRDNGLQPLRWTGTRKLSAVELIASPDLQPVRIAKDALKGQGPDRTMLVSPQHRVLFEGPRSEMLFGEAEVLVPAKYLVDMLDVTRALPAEGVTYIHLLFAQHEVILSDGIWTESFQPAERSLNALDDAVREEILTLFPELRVDADGFASARLSLKAHEAKVLLAS